jgi:hypothetical protein
MAEQEQLLHRDEKRFLNVPLKNETGGSFSLCNTIIVIIDGSKAICWTLVAFSVP